LFADEFRLIANVPDDEADEGWMREALVEGIDIDILLAIPSEAFKFLTCDGKPFEVDAIALSKSNWWSEFETKLFGSVLELGADNAGFGEGAEHIGNKGSANWLI
jgi:hypothetical protein